MIKRKIYLASSWRNQKQPEIVKALRGFGHEVYDFRNPKEGDVGFSWDQVDPNWKNWSIEEYAELLRSDDRCIAGFKLDIDALNWCDTCVLLLPCGKSAHLELGYAAGQGKRTVVFFDPETWKGGHDNIELMYLMCYSFVDNIDSLLDVLKFPNFYRDDCIS